jgi:hypothetical protein
MPMPRPLLRPTLLVLGLALGVMAPTSTMGLIPSAAAQSATPESPGTRAEPSNLEPGGGLSVEAARAAANRILEAVKSRDANRRYATFSDALKAVSSPAMVAETIRSQPQLQSWTLLSVRRGLRSTTVEVSLKTSAGERDLFMVLNSQGQLDGYHVDLTDAKASRVAADFVRALSGGHYISARSFLSLPLQEELTAATLQAKWQQLQRYTGNFVRVNRVIEAERSADSQLVLVNTEFNRITDSLFVILNSSNEIVGVDFPQDPIRPSSVAAPVR